jgi:polyisoprenoid-binding protein YceI
MGRAGLWLTLAGLLLASVGHGNGYHLNPANTQITFEINHLGLHLFSAVFHELSGDFTLDPDGHGGHLNVVVRMASIDSRSGYWNDRLQSAQWLDTDKYPEMTYRSTRVEFDGNDHATVRGDLTLHGVSRPLTLSITDIKCDLSSAEPGSCRFVARARLRRSDFALVHGFWQGGDSIDVVIRGV